MLWAVNKEATIMNPYRISKSAQIVNDTAGQILGVLTELEEAGRTPRHQLHRLLIYAETIQVQAMIIGQETGARPQ